MYTVITKGNEVSKHNSIDSIERSVEGPFLAIGNCNGSKVAFTEDSPITWPTDATDGMQAIVDVKAGTLRFEYDGWPRAHTEFVVSNYSEPVTSAPHIFDIVHYWPQQDRQCLGTKALPEDWEWRWFNDDWVLTNGHVDLKREDWFKYQDNQVAAQPTPAIGTKHDHGKPILGAIPPHAELAVGRVLTFGAEKYARGNWDNVEDHENRYMDAALRHLNAHRRGEINDGESGESHLAHAACCILFMLDKQERS